jgi:glycosyltransferase involved in cell wall biosynthesis
MIGWISESRLLHDVPLRLTDVTSWHMHVPFAFWCVEAARPRTLVELGTHRGDSYAAFCQAVSRLRLPTTCHAVDTWRGDAHSGSYGEEVYREWREYHDSRYASFSRLVRSTFDEAAAHFSDGSIDLLHIDGLHSYDAVKHDFEVWAPRLSSAAVVLFHDVNVREGEFGAWRFWEEVQRGRASFTFPHGHGLGVLLWGADAPEPLRRLAASGPEEAAEIRALFARLGEVVALRGRLGDWEKKCLLADERVREGLKRIEEVEAQLRACEAQLRACEARERRLEAQLDEQAARFSEDLLRANERTGDWAGEMERLRSELRALGLALSAGNSRSEKGIWGQVRHAGSVTLKVLYWAATLQLASGIRRLRYAGIIRRAQLFEVDYYLSQCGDFSRARRDPVDHYLQRGAAAGLFPNRFFDTSWYLEHNRDVVASGKNPLVHYIRYGAREGRATGPSFDTSSYVWQNPEVRSSSLNPLAHYLLFGAARGLRCTGRQVEEQAEPTLPQVARYGEPARARCALVVDQRILTPKEDSGSVRMFALVKILRGMGMPVTFAADLQQRNPASEQALRALGVDLLLGREAIADHLRREGQRYSLALLSRPGVASRYIALTRAYAVWAKVVYDTVDLHWLRTARAAEVTKDPDLYAESARLRGVELAMAEAADLVLTVTAEEQRMLKEAVPGARVEVIPNIHSVRAGTRPFGARRDLLFIGGYEHAPNVDAVEWFVAEILPLVRKALPEVVFQVVGSKLPERLKRLASPSVKIVGWVPDVASVFGESRVFVAPMRYGAGMLGKVGQSIEHGLPVVTTRIGAEGVGLVDGESALVAEGAEAFASAVARLYEDELLWSRIAGNAARQVEANFSEAVVGARLRRLLGGPAEAGEESGAGGGGP